MQAGTTPIFKVFGMTDIKGCDDCMDASFWWQLHEQMKHQERKLLSASVAITQSSTTVFFSMEIKYLILQSTDLCESFHGYIDMNIYPRSTKCTGRIPLENLVIYDNNFIELWCDKFGMRLSLLFRCTYRGYPR